MHKIKAQYPWERKSYNMTNKLILLNLTLHKISADSDFYATFMSKTEFRYRFITAIW